MNNKYRRSIADVLAATAELADAYKKNNRLEKHLALFGLQQAIKQWRIDFDTFGGQHENNTANNNKVIR